MLLTITLACSDKNIEEEDFDPAVQKTKIYVTQDSLIANAHLHNISVEVLEGVTLTLGTVMMSSSELILHYEAVVNVTGSAHFSDVEVTKEGGNYLCSENGADIVINDQQIQMPEDGSCLDLDDDLPVELLYFDTDLVNMSAELTWATATEINNEKFIIERSTDNQSWENIAEIEGSGNSNVKIEYDYIDNQLPNASIIYYKLKQVDFDGRTTSYGPSVISKSNVDNDISVYPNPVFQNEKLNVISNSNGIEVSIFDAIGKLIGTFSTTMNYLGIDMYYPKGIYIVEIHSGEEKTTEKIIVQ